MSLLKKFEKSQGSQWTQQTMGALESGKMPLDNFRDDGGIAEVVANAALNVFTNCINLLNQPEAGFPTAAVEM